MIWRNPFNWFWRESSKVQRWCLQGHFFKSKLIFLFILNWKSALHTVQGGSNGERTVHIHSCHGWNIRTHTLKDISTCRLEEPGIEPPIFRLTGKPALRPELPITCSKFQIALCIFHHTHVWLIVCLIWKHHGGWCFELLNIVSTM